MAREVEERGYDAREVRATVANLTCIALKGIAMAYDMQHGSSFLEAFAITRSYGVLELGTIASVSRLIYKACEK